MATAIGPNGQPVETDGTVYSTNGAGQGRKDSYNPLDLGAYTEALNSLQYQPGWNGNFAASPGVNTRVNSILGNLRTSPGNTAFQQEALRKGPSEWANAETARQRLSEEQQAQGAVKQGAAGAAAARSNLARTTGLSSGAAERLGRSAAKDEGDTEANIRGQGAQQRFGISATDDANRQKMLTALPGMETQQASLGLQGTGLWANAMNQDTSHYMQDVQGYNQFNANKFNQWGQAYGANQSALGQIIAQNDDYLNDHPVQNTFGGFNNNPYGQAVNNPPQYR